MALDVGQPRDSRDAHQIPAPGSPFMRKAWSLRTVNETPSRNTWKVAASFSVSSAQIRTVLSRAAVASSLPPGEKATAVRPAVCPGKSALTRPLRVSKTRALLSDEPVATILSSGETATHPTDRLAARLP